MYNTNNRSSEIKNCDYENMFYRDFIFFQIKFIIIIIIIMTLISWIRAKVSFALLRGALLCLRGSRVIRRPTTKLNDVDFDVEKGRAGLF